MRVAITPQIDTYLARRAVPIGSDRHASWWGPLRRGLFVDAEGKHYRAMGRALWLYGYLVVHANRRKGTLFRNISTISRDMRVSKRTVQAWLAQLRKGGYVRAQTTGRALAIEIEKWRPIVKDAPER